MSLDTEKIIEYFSVMIEKLGINLVVAGGLCPSTIKKIVLPILEKFPNYHRFSFDAEGRLRNPEDCLDIDLAKKYLLGLSKII